MNFRAKPHIKAAIHRAATLSGVDDSVFTMNAAYASALETIAAHERTGIAPVDHAAFSMRSTILHRPRQNCERLSLATRSTFGPSDRRGEPFDPEWHDRTAFSCGVEQVDTYFKKTAKKLSRADNARIYVMTSPDGTVIGLYALNAHAIDYQDLPQKFARSRPSQGSISAASLSMIGVDQRYAGQGYGGDLFVDALLRIATAAESIGIAVIILDVLNDGNADLIARRQTLYAKYGFQPLPSNPLRMSMPTMTIHRVING
jgi:uncharacterized protein (DUF1778 family)/GNAT superfamily N-acetyltransferase